MTIREMQATFGKLDSKTLLLSEGLNIIEGANESGKSTWCAFIRAMFYGINTSERDTKTLIGCQKPLPSLEWDADERCYADQYSQIW
ncbi:MAG: AAA family ATPase [Eubacteriales bacterium]